MSILESIHDAAKILDLTSKFSINDINSQYKRLLFEWHPDHCIKTSEECKEMTQKIIIAYKTMITYCYNYRFSLQKEIIEKITEDDPEAFWNSRFGNDPLWGYPNKK